MQERSVKGSVRIISCNGCSAEFPIFDYEVESDTGDVGLYSAGRCGGSGLILFDLYLEEWQAAMAGNLLHIPTRYSMAADQDYRMARILRVEQPPLPPAGISFADFRKQYRAPTVVYDCPCCGSGEAVTRSEVTSSDYIEAGGQITAILPLVLVA